MSAKRLLSPGIWRHGLPLAAAVLLAYLVSVGLRLPEPVWAVTTVLIVMRPDTGATLLAGWQRVAGSVAGALCGLMGGLAMHFGATALPTTLSIVGTLAFFGATSPIWRSAPIAAMIVLGAGELAGHSPLWAAALRLAQVALGISVAMAVSLAAARTIALSSRGHSS